MGIWYCTREDVLSALDAGETTRNRGQIDRAIAAGAGTVEGMLLRRFYPWTGTRYRDWPNDQFARSWRLWLDQDEAISVSTLTAGGNAITGFLLRPDDGPPFTHIETSLAAGLRGAFTAGSTSQRAIAITGVFGASADEKPAGALAAGVNASVTTVDVTNSSAVGVGSLLRVDSERMTVTGRTMLTTGSSLLTPVTDDMAVQSLAVTDGTAFAVDELLLLDAEKMRVDDIAGNTLLVTRAADGSTLASHTAPTIYAPRRLTVERAAVGTTAASHSSAATLVRNAPPGLVVELNLAEALNTMQQEQSAYARIVGEGDNAIEVRGQGLADIRRNAIATYGRRSRTRAV
jgi:hypothetical protein